jgi:hypothetical protein
MQGNYNTLIAVSESPSERNLRQKAPSEGFTEQIPYEGEQNPANE